MGAGYVDDHQLNICLVVALVSLVSAWAVAGMLGYWVSGAQLRQVYGLYQQAQTNADESMATTKAATTALERSLPNYQDRRFLIGLRRKMGERLSDEEVQDLCFDMDIGYDNLPASTHTGKIRELLEELRRQHRVSELVALLGLNRPETDWTKAEVA
jgi:hypothetical protein